MFESRNDGRPAGTGLRGLTAEEIVAMDLERLAWFVLADLREREGRHAAKVVNWGLSMPRQYRRDREVVVALSEAVGWLRTRNHLADDVTSTGDGSPYVVTRGGRAWLITAAPSDGPGTA